MRFLKGILENLTFFLKDSHLSGYLSIYGNMVELFRLMVCTYEHLYIDMIHCYIAMLARMIYVLYYAIGCGWLFEAYSYM